ncbi:MAG: phenylacetate-CoA oxygenase subunit PaaC [Saprospiraceae bacterium]|nr:phenylacetate-CoA oxygenase subunit PaaC [Saprospiraceae bacterium]
MDQHRRKFILQWADNAMILGQRLSEWCGHGPVLEQDIALTNIALDLIGEARYLYQLLAKEEGGSVTEDDYPFLRKEQEFYNLLLVEQPNEDWAFTIVRQCIFDHFHFHFLMEMKNSADQALGAIAEKTLKEARYHLKYSSEWLVRLGDGTDESHNKMQIALNTMAKFIGEAYEPVEADAAIWEAGLGPDLTKLKHKAISDLKLVISQSTLVWPNQQFDRTGGKSGSHSEHLGYILATMQYMQRSYPGVEW